MTTRRRHRVRAANGNGAADGSSQDTRRYNVLRGCFAKHWLQHW